MTFKLIWFGLMGVALAIYLVGSALAPVVYRWAYRNRYTVKSWEEWR